MLGSLILYFLLLCWKNRAEQERVVMFEVHCFCRWSEAPTRLCSDPHRPVSYTVVLLANGADGR